MIGLRAMGAEGGIEHVVSELAPRLVANGHEVTVYSRARWNRHGSSWRGVRIIETPTLYTKHLETIVYSAGALTRALKQSHDVVHLHAVGPALLAGVPRLQGTGTVVTIHGLDWRRDKWGPIARGALRTGAWMAARSAHQLITVSTETTQWFAQRGFPANHIPNGITPLPEAPVDAAGLADLERGYFLYLGRLVPEKAVDVAIAAHAASRTRRPLVIAGSASHTPEYVEQLRASARSDVIFAGYRGGAQKNALVHNAAALLCPSRLEGLPLTVLEAMSCALPILASDIPPHRELLPEADLLPVDRIDAWTHALDTFTPEAHEASARESQERASARYGWAPIVEQTTAVYDRAVTLARAGRSRLH